MRSFSLVWRNLTAYRLRNILTTLAIALGVAMLLTASIVGDAANRSVTSLKAEGTQIDLQVSARDGDPFDESVLQILEASPLVERTSPSLRVTLGSSQTQIDDLNLYGVDFERFAAIHHPDLAEGIFLEADDAIVFPKEIALREGINVGDEFTIKSGDRSFALTVSGLLKPEGEVTTPGVKEKKAYVSLATAQNINQTVGKINHVGLIIHSGTDVDQAKADLAELLGTELVVLRSEFRGGFAFNTMLIQGGLAMVGLIILFATGFVIMNAFAMSVTARVREIGALRALGMTQGQVVRSMFAEAGVLGFIGAGAGTLLGMGLAWAVMQALGSLEDAPFTVPWWGLLFSPLLGISATLLGAFSPVRRASRIAPIEAVRIEAQESSGWYLRNGGRAGRILLLISLPALAAYGLIGRPDIWKAMGATGVGIAGLLCSLVLLLPTLVNGVSKFIQPGLTRWMGAMGRLAADNVRRNQLRSALTAGAITVGLTMIIAFSGLLTLFMEGSIGLIGELSHEDIMISRDFVEMISTGEMSIDNVYQSMTSATIDPAIVDAFTPLVEVGLVELERVGIATVPPQITTLPTGISGGMFIDPGIFISIGNFDFHAGDPQAALQWMLRGRAVLLQPLAAERLDVSVGDNLILETTQGEVSFTVAGIGGSSLFSPIFSYADGEEYFDLMGLFQLNLIVSEDQDVNEIMDQVEEIITAYPGLVALEEVGSVIDEAAGMFSRFQALLDGLLLIAVVVASFGVVNTMVLNVSERSREIGTLRAAGSTQRQVRRMVVAEALTLGLTAAITAIVLSVLIVLVYAVLVLPNGWGALGVRADWETTRDSLLSAFGDMGIAAMFSLFIGPLVAALAAYFPARQAAALDVITATRSESLTLRTTRTRHRGISRRGRAKSS